MERNKSNRGRWIFLIISFIFMILAVSMTLYFVVFRVKEVTASETLHYSACDIITAADIEPKAFILSIDMEEVERKVREACPYISNITIEMELPNAVRIYVKEATAVFYGEIYGEEWILSGNLQLLEKKTGSTENLIEITFPKISKAIVGSCIEFDNTEDARKMNLLVTAIQKTPLAESHTINKVYYRTGEGCVVIVDRLYRLILGNTEDYETRLYVANRVLEDSTFSSGSRARIDLTDISKTAVVLDPDVDVN